MIDDETLRLAAEAAMICVMGIHGKNDGKLYDANLREWNPRDDNEDAFRLLVKLNLCIEIKNNTAHAIHFQTRLSMTCTDKDPMAAARECITELAAKIGKKMIDERIMKEGVI